MTVLVVGATGELGGSVVRLLRARGVAVRALVRPARDTARTARLCRRSTISESAG